MIRFSNSECSDFTLKNKPKYQKWIKCILSNYSVKAIELNYIFCTDQYLHNLNTEYLKHDTYTDIITFQYSEDNLHIEGDIFISIDRIKENSANLCIPFNEELLRVMSHGILHMIGFNDKSPMEQNIMRENENLCIQLGRLDFNL